jgi:NitT/TauT family transport system substrate-binding protein
VMRAWFRALDYWRQHPAEANAIMAKHYNSTPDDFGRLLTGLRWPTYEDNVAYFGTTQRPGHILDVGNNFAAIFLQTRQVSAAPALARAIDGTHLRSLYAR